MGNLEIKDKVWNKLVNEYPEKITYLDNKHSIEPSKNTITFEGEFNIPKEREELQVEIEINGKKEGYNVLLIKKPHLKGYKKLVR